MKLQEIELPTKKRITCYIGENAKDNTSIVQNAKDNNLWFHAVQCSSCHVVVDMPETFTKKEKHYIIKIGAGLCKQHTNKLRKESKVVIQYTKLKNITTTDIDGTVHCSEMNQIIV